MLNKVNGKIIRDSVHGDIYIEKYFLDLIETPEFQRLRRIHQLSVASLIYPSAEHTRFSHSIGTFHVMKKIISHFENEFKNVNITISNEEKNLALAVALLHDIGHGPFSHAFEGIANENHEEWTKKIILSKDSNINKVLIRNFGDDFPSKLVELLNKEKLIKDKGIEDVQKNEVNLFFVISSLISSQLDADRIDYLLRDSYNTGVKFGNIDLSRIINAMSLTEFNDNVYVCIGEKYLPDIEEYLLARYQMHESVYYHDTKCEVEMVIEKIFKRISEIINKENLKSIIPKELMGIFNNEELRINDYVELDDYILINMIKKLKACNDAILRHLSSVVIDRHKYFRLQIMDNSDSYVIKFKKDIQALLDQYDYRVENFMNEYFWLEHRTDMAIYKNNKENIWILKNNGVICDISELSSIVKLRTTRNLYFINKDMLLDLISNNSEISIKLDKLIETYSNRKHIEIERKYILEDNNMKDLVVKLIKSKNKYELEENKEEIRQIDTYYDTDDFELLSRGISLRIREIEGAEHLLTIKLPTIEGNSERFEYEFTISQNNLSGNLEVLRGYIENEIHQLLNRAKPVLRVNNERCKYYLKENNIMYELVFDDVKYKNLSNNESFKEMQLEIELKGNYSNRVNLKILSDIIKGSIPQLSECKESKYRRGIKLTTKGDRLL